MTRCADCSTARGVDVDHAPWFTLPPLLVRFEHFLANKGVLARPVGRAELDLPTRGGAVPSIAMPPKHLRTAVRSLVDVLTELGYLEHSGRGRWSAKTGKDPRELSVKQIQDYLLRRFPPEACKTHRDGACTRCCLVHHLSMYNKVCEAFHKMGEWLYFEEQLYGKPVWSKEKLKDVYAASRRRTYTLRPPAMNDVANSHRFQEWVETQDKRDGYMIWFLQEFGARFEEMVHAEYPLNGPFVRLDARAGVLEIRGKGREGGKLRLVTLTDQREAKLKEILAWRAKLGKELLEATGREPDPVLFPTVTDRPEQSGRARSDEAASSFNRTVLKKWGVPYNEHCGKEGHEDWKVDVDLLSSHKIGRPVYLTHRASVGVPEKILMDEGGIADHRTLERYLRFSTPERRKLMSRGDRKPDNGEAQADPLQLIDRLLETLPPGQARDLVEPMLVGARETLRRLLSNGNGKGAP